MHCFWILIHVCINSFCVYVFGFSPEVLPLQWYLQVFIISGCHFCYACDSVRHCTLGLYYSYPHTIYIFFEFFCFLHRISLCLFPFHVIMFQLAFSIPFKCALYMNLHVNCFNMLYALIVFCFTMYFSIDYVSLLILVSIDYAFIFYFISMYIFVRCQFVACCFFTLNVWPGFYFILLLV